MNRWSSISLAMAIFEKFKSSVSDLKFTHPHSCRDRNAKARPHQTDSKNQNHPRSIARFIGEAERFYRMGFGPRENGEMIHRHTNMIQACDDRLLSNDECWRAGFTVTNST
jgi:hypothetical protein